MPVRSTHVALIAACFASAFAVLPASAEKLKLTQLHYQYFAAIHAGNITKARDLAKLGNIDPANVAGYPLVSTLFNHGGKLPASVAFLSDQAFDYVFKELKQPFNATMEPEGSQTVFRACVSRSHAETHSKLLTSTTFTAPFAVSSSHLIRAQIRSR